MTLPTAEGQQETTFDLALISALNHWFARNARDLPWRHIGTSPWAILVSEVMSQQTPVARVAPRWQAWLQRWPTPAALATAATADVIREWGNLGYPRRALRLQECAQACVERFGGELPRSVAELESLPGVGSYTARAVAAYAFEQAVPVVDTNVRRVCHRAAHGNFLQGPARSRDLSDVADMMPWVDHDPALDRRGYRNAGHDRDHRDAALLMTASLMELGSLICQARTPQCELCPIAARCAWVAAGKPAPTEEEKSAAARRVQKFEGTDRQVRGLVLKTLRESATTHVAVNEIDQLWPDRVQLSRAVDSLVADRLIERTHAGITLPD